MDSHESVRASLNRESPPLGIIGPIRKCDFARNRTIEVAGEAIRVFMVQLTLVTISLELILVADLRPDLVFVQTDGTYAITPCPEAPPEQRPFRVQQLPMNPGCTLALQISDRQSLLMGFPDVQSMGTDNDDTHPASLAHMLSACFLAVLGRSARPGCETEHRDRAGR